MMTYSIRMSEFTGSSFAESQILREGIEELDIGELDDAAAEAAPYEVEVEDEPARPYRGIVAGRQWTVPATDETTERMYSVFLVEDENEDVA